ncbi:MAG: AtpZ/AtpI family protein [Nannocystaceae bacterium]|nr:AtpZ/AtpI family protein [Nannocystaceae bacterium]
MLRTKLPDTEPEEPPKPATWYRYMDASSLGIEIAVSVVLGAAAGMWVEKNVTHWAPWTSVIGMMLGVATAARAIVRTARKYTRQLREQDALERAAQAQAERDVQAPTERDTSV